MGLVDAGFLAEFNNKVEFVLGGWVVGKKLLYLISSDRLALFEGTVRVQDEPQISAVEVEMKLDCL